MSRVAKNHVGLLFILPGFLGFALFYLLPFVVSVGYSFMSRPVGGSFVGFDNYVSLLQSQAYRLGLRNTVLFIGFAVPLNMALSLGLAMIIRHTGQYKPLFVLVFLIPLVIPSGSMVFFWQAIFAKEGIINGILVGLGFERVNWLNSEWARLVLLIMFVWKNLGFNLVLFLAGLSNIPKECYEAAGVDGASRWQTLRRITLPMLMSTTVLVLLMSIINSFKVFREVYLLMGRHPHESVYMLQHFMNSNFFSLNYPRLTTATTLLAIAISATTLGLFAWEKRVLHGK